MAADFTDAEKLETVEFFIEQLRIAKTDRGGDHEIFLILKSIAADIRGRAPNAPGRARDRLQRAIDAAQASKTSGYAIPAVRRIAETVISEWPTIRQALEQFEGKTNG
jgi:alkyl hydroperoxide reductase subunit AhpC